MHYKVVVFGVKDTSENIIEFIRQELCPVDLVITIAPKVLEHNQVSGFKGLRHLTEDYGIPVFEADSYFLNDERTREFIANNSFDLGIVMGWQRLVPKEVLDAFKSGIYGFHGNCGYLPFGRGRSPLNWSIILGDTRFNLNLFRYDEHADSPNVFATEMFQINEHDDIRSAQYKNMICSKNLIRKLVTTYMEQGQIPIRTDSKDYDSWYNKRTAADGKIDFKDRTRNIYNLIRGVAAPFPGAFCYADIEDDDHKVTVWEAHPFDEMMDFSDYAPGEIIDVFDDKPIVRTVDGSIRIDRYESNIKLTSKMVLK
ncbi:methionyl-tRNA formyltransferase [Butyrivibrio proteoclasticus]|uniref:methionyl-tRNA formyltransferase n=1 Tax=Butyrivibrio proteoclasticus TaxID=43305 RepID=UPI00047B91D5|nr:formyltransferase family protein [Butyrivibrio proteoclasticus]